MKNQMIIQSPDQYQTMLDNYSSIVEKTNQQLSLWYNPYGLMIAILTLLLAIAAIIVSIILVKNSESQKKRQQQFFNEQDKIIREKNKRSDELLENAKKDLEDLIVNYETKLISTTADGKEKIEREIDELKKQKVLLGTNQIPTNTFNNEIYDPFYFQKNRSMICAKCGNSFKYMKENPFAAGVMSVTGYLNQENVYCPHCGALNIAQ